MFGVVIGFLAFQILYHLIVTVFAYGLNWIDPSLLAILRDASRVILTALIFLINFRQIKAYFQKFWKIWLGIVVLLLFGVSLSYFVFHKSLGDLLIGIKYGLRYLVIFLMASGLGFFAQKKYQKVSDFLPRLGNILIWIVVIGRIWQLLKLAFPDLFFSIGYGKLDDFAFGVQPPIYYLTGYEGVLRWQGIFAGPNNYGYFLVLFFPLILKLFPIRSLNFKKYAQQDWKNLGFILLWIITILATLSRTALLGMLVVGFLVYFPFLRKNKKIVLPLLGGIFLLGLGLSLLKRESTLGHLQAKFGGIEQVIAAPLGYGLGTAGPAIHHQGLLLPENYYLQLMLDIGVFGFMLRCGVMFLVFWSHYRSSSELLAKEFSKDPFLQMLIPLQQGLLAFLLMGMLLHVFEDSMVNYWFFILYGLSIGRSTALTTDKNTPNVLPNT